MPDDLGVAAPQHAVHLVAELRVRLCACVRVEKVLCTPLFLLRGGCGDSTLILQLGDCHLQVDTYLCKIFKGKELELDSQCMSFLPKVR